MKLFKECYEQTKIVNFNFAVILFMDFYCRGVLGRIFFRRSSLCTCYSILIAASDVMRLINAVLLFSLLL